MSSFGFGFPPDVPDPGTTDAEDLPVPPEDPTETTDSPGDEGADARLDDDDNR